MPYISYGDRDFLGSSTGRLVEDLHEVSGDSIASPGNVNYVITKIVLESMRPPGFRGWSYSSLSRALAIFRDAEAEMRRRLLDPYEDKAITKNGDIPEYER